jgi:AraC-like DNA-binding protein/mannose-6-phosphate isomerase-like protein (cupin superfamily)
VKAQSPTTQFSLWQSQQFFNIDFAAYTLSHHSFPRHFHHHFVIELVVSGADRFYCDGKNYTAENNQLVMINPGEVHTGSTVSNIPLQYYSLYPDLKALHEVAAFLDISLPDDFYFRRPLLDPSSLAQKLKQLFHSFHSTKDLLLQQELFFDCMYELLQPALTGYSSLPASINQKDSRIQLLLDYIHSHFKENISLQQLAELTRLNLFHLVRLFKKQTGLSPYNYLLILRVEHAKQLLRKGVKVQEAANSSGFYDASHFNRAFYKMAGTSPKSFRLSKSQYCTNFTA